MKDFKVLAFCSAFLLTIMLLAGCASMRWDHLEQDTVRGPAQVRQGMDITPNEITVWGVRGNGRRRIVNLTSGDISFNKHTPGVQTVRIRPGWLRAHEVTFETEVMALRSLTVASPPRVTLFKMGVTPNPAWPGLEIRGEWDQMGSHRIPLASCEITGFLPDQPGRQTIRVSFEGIQTTFDIEVRAMASLEIIQTPIKMSYLQGETLDITGLRVMGIWEGFPNQELVITKNEISGFNPYHIGFQPITITKNGRTASFDIELLGLTRLELYRPPNRTTYRVGDSLDLTGIQLFGHFTGADAARTRREPIAIEQIIVRGFNSALPVVNQRVEVEVNGITQHFFVNITQ